MPDAHDASDDSRKLECDLVMKGGITSGIIYPPLVIKLHRHGYSFRNIGGTSAGAIAAAVAAAAEYGKDKRDKDGKDGFKKLDDVSKWLGEDGNLRNLFQPSKETAPLMNTLFGYSDLKALRWPPLRIFVSLFIHDFWAFVGGGLLGVAVSFLFSWLVSGTVKGAIHGGGLFVLVLSALAGALVFCAWHLYHVIKNVLPDERFGFGLCTGRGEDLRKLDETVLTDWLSARINDIAGKDVNDAPLTFGELWEPLDEEGRKKIDLRMMTSDLSQNQPYVLPFDDELFIFDEREMLRFFPHTIVNHLIEHARHCEGLEPPYHLLPEAKDLPVVFATRMSLSFPVLISMIPLYTQSRKALDRTRSSALDPKKDLQRNWFSDGGICSNFPIHFFDAWLPKRPTFGVNLTSQLAGGALDGSGRKADLIMSRSSLVSFSSGHEKQAAREAYSKDVYLPKADEILPPEWMPINGVGKFFETIFRTAQNYRDNMQAMLPSYRERIVQIRLTDEEGGLNLDMSEETINEVVKKGGDAGELLVGFDLPSHQWVRFRVLMKQMEKSLYDLKKAIAPGSFYEAMLKTRPLNSCYPYQRDNGWLDNAKQRLEDIGGVIDQIQKMNPEILFSDESPLPEPVLRVTPQI